MMERIGDAISLAILVLLFVGLAFLFEGDPDIYDMLLSQAHGALEQSHD